jgi:excisionase family DNA binding protein
MTTFKTVKIYRVPRAMEALGVSRSTIYRLVAAGSLTLVKIGRKASGITLESMEALIEAGKVKHQ